jgi:hypothetical protein
VATQMVASRVVLSSMELVLIIVIEAFVISVPHFFDMHMHSIGHLFSHPLIFANYALLLT